MTNRAVVPTSCDPVKIAAEMNSTGFAVVENYIDAEQLRRAQHFVEAAVKSNGGDCIIFRGPRELAGTFMYDLPRQPSFSKLCCDIYRAGTGYDAPSPECYQVLRCLCGAKGQKNSMHFHYDTYALAALIPITIPTKGKMGDLLMLPNVRRFRDFYTRSLMDKALLASPLQQHRLKNMYKNHDDRLIRIKMVPGNLYFFWGYRSAHANEECDKTMLRCTALFHFVDPHANSVLKTLMPTSRLKNIINPTRIVKGLSVYR